jgi:hypothetical protein
MRVAQRSLVPAQAAHQRECQAGVLGASGIECFFCERLDACGLGVWVFRPARAQADLFELDAEPHSLWVWELPDEAKAATRVSVRFGVCEHPKAPTSRGHARADRHGRVASDGRVMGKLERDRPVGVIPPIEKLRDSKVHQLAAGLRNLRIDHPVNQRVVKSVHLR